MWSNERTRWPVTYRPYRPQGWIVLIAKAPLMQHKASLASWHQDVFHLRMACALADAGHGPPTVEAKQILLDVFSDIFRLFCLFLLTFW